MHCMGHAQRLLSDDAHEDDLATSAKATRALHPFVPASIFTSLLVATLESPRPQAFATLSALLLAGNIALSRVVFAFHNRVGRAQRSLLQLAHGPVRLLFAAFLLPFLAVASPAGWLVSLPVIVVIPIAFRGRRSALVALLLMALVCAAVWMWSQVPVFIPATALATTWIVATPLIWHLREQSDELRQLALELQAHQVFLEERVREKTKHALDAQHAAEEANATKSQFVANITHELRTPLHGILSFNRFAIRKLGKVPDAKMQGYFTQIDTSARLLLSLVSNLLDLSKLEAGHMSLSLAPTSLRSIGQGIVDEFEPRCSEAHVGMRLIGDDVDVWADADMLAQVTRNLVANAVHHSPVGGHIDISVHRAGDRAQLVVSDDGPGIPTGELDRIFESFQQSSSTSNGAGGTGLGLAICKSIVDLHHGHISAHNRPGGGASFVVEFPVLKASAPHLLP